jgi:putative ABC transport system substrate-binding protein
MDTVAEPLAFRISAAPADNVYSALSPGEGQAMFRHLKAPRTRLRHILCLMLTGILLTACGGTTPAKIYTIGVVNYVPALAPVFEGFKARMTELGYVEGQNVTYIYHGVLAPDRALLEHEIKRIMDQKSDLFLTLGTLPTLAAKKVLQGTDIPVVFAPVINPVEEGVVESISRPGGNVTGIQNGDTIPKALEWLHIVAPHATKIAVLYHPNDNVALTAITPLPALVAALGVELLLIEAQSLEAVRAAIADLPKDVAIFLVPTPSLEPLGTLTEAAVQRGLAVGVNNIRYLQSGGISMFGADYFAMGQQAARLADQVLKGAKPADLPVETAEYFLKINLKTAAAIGLDIPDEVLRQAHSVIR